MWKEPYIVCCDFLPLAAGSGDSYVDAPFKIFRNNDYEIVRSIYKSTDGQINIRMTNESTGHDVIRQQGDIRAVSSTALSVMTPNGFIPYNFPVPYLLPAGTNFVVSAADKSGSANRLRFALHGNKIYDGDAPYKARTKRELFSFTIKSGTLAAYGSVVVNLTLNESYGFLAAKLTGTVTGEGLVFIQDYDMRQQDATESRPWSNKDVHFYNMIGNSQFGNLLTARKWVPEKSTISVRFTDLSGSANAMSITFHGEKIFSV
jgi:hypothetical protein